MVKPTSTPAFARQPVLAVPVSATQKAWLSAMGVDVPWIVGQPTKKPTLAASAAPVEPVAHSKDTTPDSRLDTPEPESAVRADALIKPLKASQPVKKATTEVRESVGDLSGLSLDDLRAKITPCQACGLCEQRTHAVSGEGSDTPDLVIVGEAPGEQEDLEGRPFVGRSGALLSNMLRAINLDRSAQVFITNVVKCRPPANRNPREDEISACLPYLHRQIALLQPKVVLAMGRFAAHALLQTSEPLQKLRQQSQVLGPSIGSIPVVVTYHPAYLLRRPVDKRLAWEDLKRAQAYLRVAH